MGFGPSEVLSLRPAYQLAEKSLSNNLRLHGSTCAVRAREADYRSKNILAAAQAMVRLSESDTTDGLKSAIEGRIQALTNVHALFLESRWTG
jgi:two-component sensor histidine kinase